MSVVLVSAQLLRDVLDTQNYTGNFMASVLTNDSGLPLATATSTEKDMAMPLAAVVPLMQQNIQRSNRRIGLPVPREVVVENDDGTLLVIRFFAVSDRELILASLVPAKQTYRRVMNTAIRAITRLWHESSRQQSAS